MPITERATINSFCTFSKDRKHRFLLTFTWDEKKPKVAVIMKAPADANCIVMDLTTSLVIKNLYHLGYGGCDILNLGSKLDYVKKVVDEKEENYNKENRDTILKCVADERNEKVICAWGTCGDGNKRIKGCENEILKLLSDYQDKLYTIEDERGKRGLHPLTPTIRNKWILVPLDKIEIKELEEKKEKPKRKTKKDIPLEEAPKELEEDVTEEILEEIPEDTQPE